MNNSSVPESNSAWLDRQIVSFSSKITIEKLLVFLIILAAVISRFYNIGDRVMAHDEVNHVIPSYDLYVGKGYKHDPMTHGPMQFHLLAATYFLLGDSDFSSRVPAALFSIATIVFVLFAYRRYLGRTGALLSGLFFLISPFMLFYGSYTRNEAFIELFGVILLFLVLYYLEKGNHSTIYLYAIVLSLYFCTKETSFIFTAEMLIFLAILFLKDVTQVTWNNKRKRELFIILTLLALLFLGAALGSGILDAKSNPAPTPVEGSEIISTAAAMTSTLPSAYSITHMITLTCIGLAVICLILAACYLIASMGWSTIKNYRSFDLLVLTFTLVLPQLIAFPISMLGWDPLDYTQSGLIQTSIILLISMIIAVVIGLLWKPALWAKNAVIFYTIFFVFYTTFFTNGQGFFTGIVGSLGYWLSQQAFQRGTQPLYYYAFLQIPMYEYLAAAGTVLAVVIGIRHKFFSTFSNIAPAEQISIREEPLPLLSPELPGIASLPDVEEHNKKIPVLTLLIYWSAMSLIAFTVAGEKMPWLTVHITLPMLLASGFGLGYILDTLPKDKWNTKSLLAVLIIPLFLICLAKILGLILAPDKPFAGLELPQLQTTSTFLFSVIGMCFSGWGIIKFLAGWKPRELFKALITLIFGVLAILTARSAYQVNYINDDTAKEFLVYAHAPSGPKEVLAQVEELSIRTTGGKDIKVAYIGSALYPYWWYFRDYPNKSYYGEKLTRDLLQYPVVISDHIQIDKVRAILKNNYYEFKYKRLVWPMEDYNHQTLSAVWAAFKDPLMRKAVFDIWLNKDYTLYSQLKSRTNLTPENWVPSEDIYLFMKKDLVNSIWSYGSLPGYSEPAAVDPYAAKMINLTPDQYFGTAGSAEGQLNTPHGIAVASDDSIYVTDGKKNRIQHFSADGQFLNSWGTFASLENGEAPGGTFNEPWGIAIGPDGSVYVTDTWNHRVQKFTANGKFLTMWGTAGTSDSKTTFWGPRGIAVNQNGQVFITDTGNNRVVIYDDNGTYLNQFGVSGIGAGEFSEPVGLTFDKAGNLFVLDTWNQRVQVFQSVDISLAYQPVREWQVDSWLDQSINNKPFIAVDGAGHVFVTDPAAFRVLEFDSGGAFIRGWGGYSSEIDGLGLPIGIAVDSQGRVLISDTENNSILRFTLPD
ncbi:MAG TPA: hypothetical protein DIW44_08675 [Anaerolineaceae bacterium]|nr:hypothetical protein [Anaerolineaceae bacterium]